MKRINFGFKNKNLMKVVILAIFLAVAGAVGWLVFLQSKLLSEAQDDRLALETDLAGCRADKNIEGGGILDSKKAVELAVDYINHDLLKDGKVAVSDYKADEVSGIYEFNINIDGKDYDTYVTKDGEIMFAQAHKITVDDNSNSQGTIPKVTIVPETNEVDKTNADNNKPDVKLFVMSYCPFGLQAQKMYLPVYNLLKGKVNMGIYFVDYAMHGKKELEENLRQYCIQKEQSGKYAEYLDCFTSSTPGADGIGGYSKCLDEAGVDKTKLDLCVATTDSKFKVLADYAGSSTWINGRYPKFAVNGAENEQYGVEGSPTVIINGDKVNVSQRSPQKFLETICNVFKEKPAECGTKLDSQQMSTGFGKGAASNSSGGCGG